MQTPESAKPTGGAAVVDAVIGNGVDTVFGLPGAQIYPLFDALYRRELRVYVPRHEQTAAYMAMGYAKSTGGPSVCCVVPGPGVLNASAALCTAMGNCASVVCLTGQVPSEYLGRGRGHLHELADQRATLRGIVKDAQRIDDAVDTRRIVDEAFITATSGRPGPVAIEMCWDTMAAVVGSADAVALASDVSPASTASYASTASPAPAVPSGLAVLSAASASGATAARRSHLRTVPPAPDLDAIHAAATLLAGAKNPLVMCGAGAQHAGAEVLALAESLNAPVTAFRSGRGVVAEDHPLGVASVAARELWDDVDVLIGIGSRLEMPYMRWRSGMRYERKPKGPALIRVDIDPSEMTRLQPDVAIVADAAVACRLLADRLAQRVRPSRHRLAEIAAAKAIALDAIRTMQPQAAYLEVIRDLVPRTGFLVPEVSQMGFATYTGAYPVLAPRTYVSEGFQGTLGFGFPTALGVKVAHPDRVVVSIAGDGGFMFGMQELATAAQYGIGVVTLVFNNNAYGNVLRDQQTQYGGRLLGAELRNPDFVALGESFGVDSFRARSPSQLKPLLEKAIEAGRPALIEISVERGSETSPWPLIHMSSRPSSWLKQLRA